MEIKSQKSEVGRVLRKIREEKGLSCLDIARLCGLTKQGVWYMEQGDMPLFDTVRRVAAALGVTLNVIDKELGKVEIVREKVRKSNQPHKV